MILDMPAETFIWLCFVFGAFFGGMTLQKHLEESQERILKAENEILKEENSRLYEANDKLNPKKDLRYMNEPY